MTAPRKWSLILNGPNNGCIAPFGDTWPHAPADKERVTVMEVLSSEAMSEEGTYAQEGTPAEGVDQTPTKSEVTPAIQSESLDDLARSLGIVFNDQIAHNSVWFVPESQQGYATSGDAIRGLFAALKDAAASRATPDAPPAPAQSSLF